MRGSGEMAQEGSALITIVSGLPRSGTSMMMRMLVAAGVPALTDHTRSADADNPHGYFELEAVKRTRADRAWIGDAAGKCVKVIHLLLPDLPAETRCRIVFMDRDLDEVVASQRKMLERSGRSGALVSPEVLKRVYTEQLRQVDRWFDTRPGTPVLRVRYADVLADPQREAARLADFLGGSCDRGRMAAAVDPGLYRNRREVA